MTKWIKISNPGMELMVNMKSIQGFGKLPQREDEKEYRIFLTILGSDKPMLLGFDSEETRSKIYESMCEFAAGDGNLFHIKG